MITSTVGTDLFTFTLAAGELGTANGVHIHIPLSDVQNDNGAGGNMFIRLIYGGTTIAQVTIQHDTTDTGAMDGSLDAYLFADAANNVQFGWMSFCVGANASNNANAKGGVDDGVGAESSAGALTLRIEAEITASATSRQMTALGGVAMKLIG